MRKYVLTLATIIATGLASIGVFNWLVDPTGVFGNRPPERVYFLSDVELKSDLLFAQYGGKTVSLVLGSSRSMGLRTALLERLTGKSWFNDATSSAVADDIEDALAAALAHGVHVDEILIGLDYVAFTKSTPPATFPPRRLYEYGHWNPQFWTDHLWSYGATSLSVRTILYAMLGEPVRDRIDDSGNFYRDSALTPGELRTMFASPMPDAYDEGTRLIPDKLTAWRFFMALARQNDIKLTVFGPPLYWKQTETQDFAVRREIDAAVIEGLGHGFVDFGGLNEITGHYENYTDYSHFDARVAERIVRRLYGDGGDDRFGTFVDMDNLDAYLAQLAAALGRYRETMPASARAADVSQNLK